MLFFYLKETFRRVLRWSFLLNATSRILTLTVFIVRKIVSFSFSISIWSVVCILFLTVFFIKLLCKGRNDFLFQTLSCLIRIQKNSIIRLLNEQMNFKEKFEVEYIPLEFLDCVVLCFLSWIQRNCQNKEQSDCSSQVQDATFETKSFLWLFSKRKSFVSIKCCKKNESVE